MTDQFSIRLEGRTIRLTLRQDLAYPSVEPEPGNFLAGKGQLSINPNPDSFLVRDACIPALGLFSGWAFAPYSPSKHRVPFPQLDPHLPGPGTGNGSFLPYFFPGHKQNFSTG
ncbi:hypothetical protein [Desulforapulum autotrophicum]|uniref:hypothetical protein n=1 Tax=Desulforapulum autotrophicum TaxID=2296 RepID=UPI0002E9104A|nr:hypothetical protein [Desulforapulum autotrophicum]